MKTEPMTADQIGQLLDMIRAGDADKLATWFARNVETESQHGRVMLILAMVCAHLIRPIAFADGGDYVGCHIEGNADEATTTVAQLITAQVNEDREISTALIDATLSRGQFASMHVIAELIKVTHAIMADGIDTEADA